MKTEVQHFADSPDLKRFMVEKFTQSAPAYGIKFARIVKNYLTGPYIAETSQADVVSDGVTYKVLKRDAVTAFYDSEGNTLFDVENTRLAKEYGFIGGSEKTGSEEREDSNNEVKEMDENSNKEEADQEAGASEKQRKDNQPEEHGDVHSESERAVSKLKSELAGLKDKDAEMVINHLIERCEEDKGLASDVLQSHKTWDKCRNYIYEKARKQSSGKSCMVRDNVVYEWAEDYYHEDDKAAEARKAKEVAERKKADEERAKKAKSEAKKPETKTSPTENKKPAESKKTAIETGCKIEKQPKPVAKKNEYDGQMDLFSMMGI